MTDTLRQTYDALRLFVEGANSSLREIELLSERTNHLGLELGEPASGPAHESIAALRAELASLRRKLDIVEPFAHVEEVERLRQQNQPEQVKLLLVAESHVRVSDEYFGRKGSGFIYEPRYTTPWWRGLLLPGFGSTHKGRLTPELKTTMLDRMREAGFWVLDASVLSLSGYAKLAADAGNRPFSMAPYTKGLESAILKLSWQNYVQAAFYRIMSGANPPVLVTYRRVAHLLPFQWQNHAAPFLVFSARKNQALYSQTTFVGGTETFRLKAAQAGIDTCLRDG